ncbi:MAG: hypothetical protein M1824_000150 [Vezdaea acicularis]|nr:MAG: hypothetical protein M1824_000150 [Vezdaea acicularis]
MSAQPSLPPDAAHPPLAPTNTPQTAATPHPLLPSLLSTLTTKHALHPHPPFLQTLLNTHPPTTPLPRLTEFALTSILRSNITRTLSPPPSALLPCDISGPGLASRKVLGPVVCQVLRIEDVGRSRWEQVEALEARERGEGRRGWVVVRVGAEGEEEEGEGGGGIGGGGGGTAGAATAGGVRAEGGGGTWKLLLQDARGTNVWAITLKDVKGVDGAMGIGCKLLLKDVAVARGVVLLEPRSTVVLGGVIEEANRKWVEGRKEELKKAVGPGGAG